MEELNLLDGGVYMVPYTSFATIPQNFLFKVAGTMSSTHPTKSGNFKRLQSVKELVCGEEIFSIDTILVAPGEGWGCLGCGCSRCVGYCDPSRFYLQELRSVIQSIPKIASDFHVSEAILRLVVKYISLKKGENNASPNGGKLKDLLDSVFTLNYYRDEGNTKNDNVVADKLHSLLPPSHKNFINKERLSLLLRILILNSISIPQMHGVALYPCITFMDHSCKENCRIEFDGTKVTLTPITPISKDTSLTLNFLDVRYSPRVTRQAEIKSKYNCNCICELCSQEKDQTRVFICKKCNTNANEDECGLVCPKNDGSSPNDWSCSLCSSSPTKELHQEYLKLEENNKNIEINALPVNDLLKGKLMHPSHYILHRSLVLRANFVFKIRPMVCEKYVQLILFSVGRFMGPIHPERSYFFDLLGQIRKLLGDRDGCKEAYTEASNIRDKISTKTSPLASLARQKAVNPEKVDITYWYPMVQ